MTGVNLFRPVHLKLAILLFAVCQGSDEAGNQAGARSPLFDGAYAAERKRKTGSGRTFREAVFRWLDLEWRRSGRADREYSVVIERPTHVA